jgi:hypothetical protein
MFGSHFLSSSPSPGPWQKISSGPGRVRVPGPELKFGSSPGRVRVPEFNSGPSPGPGCYRSLLTLFSAF